MTTQSAIQEILRLDDGEWEQAFDSLCIYNHLDTLSEIKSGGEPSGWRVEALLDYMRKCVRQQDRRDDEAT